MFSRTLATLERIFLESVNMVIGRRLLEDGKKKRWNNDTERYPGYEIVLWRGHRAHSFLPFLPLPFLPHRVSEVGGMMGLQRRGAIIAGQAKGKREKIK